MKFHLSRRQVAVVVGAIAMTAAAFAPPAVAKSGVSVTISCGSFTPSGSGTVTVFTNGRAKGHCFFPNGFPNLTGNLSQPLHHAVLVQCAALAPALGFAPGATGKVTLTPSGHANVNCRHAFISH